MKNLLQAANEKRAPLFEQTDAYRVVNGAADGFPGIYAVLYDVALFRALGSVVQNFVLIRYHRIADKSLVFSDKALRTVRALSYLCAVFHVSGVLLSCKTRRGIIFYIISVPAVVFYFFRRY